MKITPKSEQEVSNKILLQPGIYDCEVMEAEDKISTAGNEMIKVKLGVFDKDGKRHIVFDYLMEKLAYKLRHAAFAFGQGESYEKGLLEAIDLQGQAGKVKLKIVKDLTGNYPDKNEVVDYVVPLKTEKLTKAKIDDALGSEEIPF